MFERLGFREFERVAAFHEVHMVCDVKSEDESKLTTEAMEDLASPNKAIAVHGLTTPLTLASAAAHAVTQTFVNDSD